MFISQWPEMVLMLNDSAQGATSEKWMKIQLQRARPHGRSRNVRRRRRESIVKERRGEEFMKKLIHAGHASSLARSDWHDDFDDFFTEAQLWTREHHKKLPRQV